MPAPTEGLALGDEHGHIDGAREMAEPQAHLLTLDERGDVAHLDLLDDSVDAMGTVDGVESLTTEGRYAYAVRPEDDAVTVIDSGVWTRSHIDHFHYYRAAPKRLGEIQGDGRATVSANDAGAGVLFTGSGEAVVVHAESLGDASLDETFRIRVEPHDGLVVPVGSGAIVTEPGPDGIPARVRALDADGAPHEAAECETAAGTITTVVGVVVGCSDGALLATIVEDETIRFERIPYPEGVVAPAAQQFRARDGRPTVAALAGAPGATAIWLLDTRELAWDLVDVGEPLLQATAVDDADGHVLVLTAEGRVRVLAAATGERIGTTEPILADTAADPERLAGVELIADQDRAYLNGVAEHRLFEIDYADAARISREFETASEPRLLVETGR